jgi:hypothetical protein
MWLLHHQPSTDPEPEATSLDLERKMVFGKTQSTPDAAYTEQIVYAASENSFVPVQILFTKGQSKIFITDFSSAICQGNTLFYQHCVFVVYIY